MIINSIEDRKNLIRKLLKEKNLTILIIGYGLTGKSFLDWCIQNTDKTNKYIISSNESTHTNLDKINNKNIQFINDSNREIYTSTIDIILPSPGVLFEKTISWYKKIIPELDLAFFIFNAFSIKTILITGSIGKTSTSTLVYQTLKKLKKSVFLCGNIGIPILNIINKKIKKKKTIIIIEASSSQLKHTVLVCPTYFVVTNIFQNHLDSHPSLEDYIKSKLNPIKLWRHKIKKIFLDNTALLLLKTYSSFPIKKISKKIIYILDKNNNDNYNQIIHQNFYNSIFEKNDKIYYKNKNKKIYSQSSFIPEISYKSNWKIILGLFYEYKKIKDLNFILKSNQYKLPPYRLEKIIQTKNVTIYNDSKSTIMESTINGIKKIKKMHPTEKIICIIGNLSKGICRIEAIKKIYSKVDSIMIFGQEKNIFQEKLFTFSSISYYKNISHVLKKIDEKIKKEKKPYIILFSPGGSSFDQFSSYIERGKIFTTLSRNIFLRK